MDAALAADGEHRDDVGMVQMGGGMVLSVVVFLAGWLTVRHRPWPPHLSAWIAVAIQATTAGVLFGVAADKMFYESLGFGGWLQWGALVAAGVLVAVSPPATASIDS